MLDPPGLSEGWGFGSPAPLPPGPPYPPPQHLAKWLVHCKHLLHGLILACDLLCAFLLTLPTVLLFTLPALFAGPSAGKG